MSVAELIIVILLILILFVLNSIRRSFTAIEIAMIEICKAMMMEEDILKNYNPDIDGEETK